MNMSYHIICGGARGDASRAARPRPPILLGATGLAWPTMYDHSHALDLACSMVMVMYCTDCLYKHMEQVLMRRLQNSPRHLAPRKAIQNEISAARKHLEAEPSSPTSVARGV